MCILPRLEQPSEGVILAASIYDRSSFLKDQAANPVREHCHPKKKSDRLSTCGHLKPWFIIQRGVPFIRQEVHLHHIV